MGKGKNLIGIFFVKPNPSIRHFYNRFSFGSARLAFGESISIVLVLSGSMCIVVDLGIGCLCY